jgi:hypothetical protein
MISFRCYGQSRQENILFALKVSLYIQNHLHEDLFISSTNSGSFSALIRKIGLHLVTHYFYFSELMDMKKGRSNWREIDAKDIS